MSGRGCLEVLAVALIVALMSGGCTGGAAPAVTTTTTMASTTSSVRNSTSSAPSTSTSIATTTSDPTTTTTEVTTTSISVATTSTTTTTSEPPVEPARVVTRGQTDERVIALTFDAGSDRGFAEEILDTLSAHGIKASFGMTGRWAESNPDLLRRMVADGHSLINHTYDHPHMETLSTEQRLDQLQRTETIISEIAEVGTKPYFRPPYGSYNNQVLIDLATAGYRYSVMWTVDCLGWKGLPPSDVAERCKSALVSGAILLMHVGAASTDYAALEDIIAAIDQGGYRYATIPELLP